MRPKRKRKTSHHPPGEPGIQSYALTVPGPVRGAVRTTQRAKWVDPAYARYRAFKTTIRLYANQAGIPIALRSDQSACVRLSVNWVGRQRCDLDNVLKGLLDALWANDRRVTEIVGTTRENTGDESISIEVEIWQGTERPATATTESAPTG